MVGWMDNTRVDGNIGKKVSFQQLNKHTPFFKAPSEAPHPNFWMTRIAKTRRRPPPGSSLNAMPYPGIPSWLVSLVHLKLLHSLPPWRFSSSSDCDRNTMVHDNRSICGVFFLRDAMWSVSQALLWSGVSPDACWRIPTVTVIIQGQTVTVLTDP